MAHGLLIVDGPGKGSFISFDESRRSYVIGRNPNCDIAIPVSSVSSKHAQIVREQNNFFIEKLAVRKGIFVNDQKIGPRTRLRNNDKIRLGKFTARFVESDIPSGQENIHQQDIVQALSGSSTDSERNNFQFFFGQNLTLKQCRRIRAALKLNHVFLDGFEADEVQHSLLLTNSHSRKILGKGFHRLILLDAVEGVDRRGKFGMERFLRYVHEELMKAFDLESTQRTYHPENIAQVLKDEPRSLFCFLNVQNIPVKDLRKLRGFTQELHQTLFICCRTRDLVKEETAYRRKDLGSDIHPLLADAKGKFSSSDNYDSDFCHTVVPPQIDQLKQLLGSLPPIYREILLMRFGEQLSTDEIAKKVNVSRRTVYRSINKLARLIKKLAQD